jgi:hypothetical protein
MQEIRPRLLGRYRRSGADLFDLGDQTLAVIGAARLLQTFTQRPQLFMSLLFPAQIAFRLSTHIPYFLLEIEMSLARGTLPTITRRAPWLRTKKNPKRGKYPWQESNLRPMV